jgi:hypothetical protein
MDASVPVAMPSRQTVFFHVFNVADSDRFVLLHGLSCDPFGVQDPLGPVLLTSGDQCVCSCRT